MDSQSGGHLGQDRKVPSTAGGNLSRMHKTEKTAKESRMNFMYSHLCDTTLVGQDFTEKAIALDLARDVALKTATPFPAIGKRAAGLYDEDPPIWYEYRHRVMNQRPCNHEERGIRAWKIA